MIQIAVCDDQPDHLKKISQMLQDACKKLPERYDCHANQSFDSAEAVLDFLRAGKIDILFLDIELKGKSGFTLASYINKESPETIIIFVSSYENYVFQSFEYEPFRFIRKFYLNEELEPALYAAINKHIGANKTLLLKATQGDVELRHRDILFFESSRNYVIVHTSENQTYTFRSTLNSLEEKIKADDFFRIHHAFLVNLSNIKRIEGCSGVVMKNGIKLPISAKQRTLFKTAYMEYTNRRFSK